MKRTERQRFGKAFVVLFLVVTTMLCSFFSFTANAGWQDFSTPLLTLEAEEGHLAGQAALRGEKVGNMGQWGNNPEGSVTFKNLNLKQDGEYVLKIHYMSGSDDRYFLVTAAGVETNLPCPNTGSFDKVGTVLLTVTLEAGGDLKIGSDYYAPDLDKVEIFEKDAFVFPERSYVNAENVTIENRLLLDTKNGVFSLLDGEKTVLKNAHGEAFVNGATLSTDDFKKHDYKQNCDGCYTFTHTEHPAFGGSMVQTFTLKEGYILVDLMVIAESGQTLSTNYMSPVSVYTEGISMENGVFLQIPFDNDKWVEPRFIAQSELGFETTSYEVAAFYDSKTSKGFVFGSVRHDTWKTGIDIYTENGTFKGLNVFGGVSDFQTRDKAPHGFISGGSAVAPTVFVGYYGDYKAGLTAYGKANTDLVPAKQSVKDVPFGFNSWGSMGTSVNYSKMVAVSTYIKNNLQQSWQSDGAAVYVNIDSYWDYLVKNDYDQEMTLDEALASYVAICRENGQKAGIYFTPFATWLGDENALKSTKMEGSDYTFYDAALRLQDGSLYGNSLAGGFALDPTHPGTIARIEDRFNYFKDLGFEYVKLDFLTHGALEGAHYDKSVSTGLQAYNSGMKRIHELAGDELFINLSIAPIFPYQYADGRRISCDAFSSKDSTMHVLSYLSACFFEKELYAYPDPDHILVLGESEGVARMRVTSGAISGTSFLIGDDLSKVAIASDDYQRLLDMYCNKDVISVIKMGAAFTPLDAGADKRCANIYYHVENGKLYLAVFNFDGWSSTLDLDLSTLLPALSEGFEGKELWTGSNLSCENGNLSYDLPEEDAVLFELTVKGGGAVDPTPDPSTSEDPSKEPTPTPEVSGDPTASAPTSADGEDEGKDGLSSVVVGAIVCGVAAVIVVAVIAVVIVVLKKKKK